MIVEKHKKETETIEEVVSEIKQSKQLILEESYNVNALAEAYLAVKEILSGIKLNDTPDSPPLFRTIKLDTGQLARIKNNKHNQQYALAFPAVFIHFINVYYNVGQSRIGEGKGVMRIHYVLNTLNLEDDEVELEGLKVYNLINQAINENKSRFPALVNRFQLAYWEQPLSFDDGLQPYWIDYDIWFNEYSGYRYKNYVDRHIVMPPFTDHGDQIPEIKPDDHDNHKEVSFDEVSGFNK